MYEGHKWVQISPLHIEKILVTKDRYVNEIQDNKLIEPPS